MAKNSLSVDAADLTSRITRTPFPGSRKIYIEGSRPDIRVPFREVTLTDTLVAEGNQTRREPNPPLRLFDASGVYTDPAVSIDITTWSDLYVVLQDKGDADGTDQRCK